MNPWRHLKKKIFLLLLISCFCWRCRLLILFLLFLIRFPLDSFRLNSSFKSWIWSVLLLHHPTCNLSVTQFTSCFAVSFFLINTTSIKFVASSSLIHFQLLLQANHYMVFCPWDLRWWCYPSRNDDDDDAEMMMFQLKWKEEKYRDHYSWCTFTLYWFEVSWWLKQTTQHLVFYGPTKKHHTNSRFFNEDQCFKKRWDTLSVHNYDDVVMTRPKMLHYHLQPLLL